MTDWGKDSTDRCVITRGKVRFLQNSRFFGVPTLKSMARAASRQSRWPLNGLISIFEKRIRDDTGGYFSASTEIEIIGVDG